MTGAGFVGLTALGMEQVVNQMPGGVAIMEAESGRIVYTNARARELVDWLGKTMPAELSDEFEIFHLDGRPYRRREWPVVRSMTSGEHVVDEEYFSVLPDGGRLIIRCSASPVYDERGQIVAGVLVMNDVTEQKRAEGERTYHADLLEHMQDAVLATDDRFVLTAWNKGAEEMFGWTAQEAVGRPVYEVLPQDYSDEQQGEELLELTRTGRWRGERVWSAKDGTPVFAEGLTVAVRGEHDETIGYLCIMRDVAERDRAEEERERWARQQAGVADLGLRALAAADLQALMDEACALVGRTLDVELAKVSEVVGAGEELLIRAGTGWRDGVVGFCSEPAGRGSHQGYTLLAGGPVVAEDLLAEERFRPGAVVVEHGAVSEIGVVIEGRDEPFGVLAALSTRPRAFSAGDASFMQAIANVLAAAVERARAAQAMDEIRESERSRIARDLHDEALQELTDALVQADGGASAGLPADAAERLASALRRAAQQLRAAIYDLRLAEHESRPFPEALGALVAVHRALAVDCEIHLDAAAAIPTGPVRTRQTEILRIVGEALTNARRHSGARHIGVRARGGIGGFRIAVTDDGRGFDPARESSGAGTGIQGMRERAALLDGTLDIRSSPGAGTAVRLQLGRPDDDEGAAHPARILLVEDHMAVREAIAGMLEREPDLTVVAQAGSLAEARGMLRDVDVAVVDLGLPDGDGTELIPELRDVNPWAHALVLSASLDTGQLSRVADAGATGALDKTAHLDELVDAVRRLHLDDVRRPSEPGGRRTAASLPNRGSSSGQTG
jgi:PAS domain S-box-containing protein